jgi:hypothetical protein
MRQTHHWSTEDQRQHWARIFEVSSATVILILLAVVMLLMFTYHTS